MIVVAAVSACSPRQAAREPVVPENLERLDPAVRALVQEELAEVRAAPGDGQHHGRLGLVYEANLLWEEAREAFRIAVELKDSEFVFRRGG
ncbi:MAG: hypothetical protein ACRD2Z_17620 [Thermoanaerobaculia bacterium]